MRISECRDARQLHAILNNVVELPIGKALCLRASEVGYSRLEIFPELYTRTAVHARGTKHSAR